MFGEMLVAVVTAVMALANPATSTPTESGRTTLTAADADRAVTTARQTVKADPTSWRWGCELPMTINPAAGAGVKADDITEQLAYPVEYLRGLGYNVTIGEPVDYARNMPTASNVGQVIIAATKNRREQPGLEGQAAYAHTNTSGRDALAATIFADANPKTGELAGDILLHELGHVLGLGHKAGTVMAVDWDAPIGFDAAEIAAVDCR